MEKLPEIHGPVLVCVTPQRSCTRLIQAGEMIALENHRPMKVLSIFKENTSTDAGNSEILEELHEAARMADATMSVYFNDSPAILAAVVAVRENAGILVTGFPRDRSTGFITEVHELVPNLPIVMLDDEMNEHRILPDGAEVPVPMPEGIRI